ncbi:CaiB/BaiF CoA transferase family protein [Anditalea andensis]|uniref:Carnitine dehydratase n=1 Tax=Anditalea andensis TaxID=1048983 RepID=A0A074KZE4_9BACT|nr:CaiB/BaiF CoA-transferase family protein [Anditalea andensis]KEO74289.1 carnitine dehydratase [Anditalea andensis]
MTENNKKGTYNPPLKGVVVLEFCQYLSGPSAGLRLADLGARVIKIENPNKGDLCRILPIKNQWVGGDSLLFHTINRNKESYTANLKSQEELDGIKNLIKKADVLIHNFRPGVMAKLGLGFDEVNKINPRLVFAEISGYGNSGPWAKKPGQDLLVQAMTGLMYASGDKDNAPTPFGLAIGDILCGLQMVQGIIAALIYRNRSGKGVKIELSLFESLLDFQFESLTTFFVSGKKPSRSAVNNAHPLLGAPYGIYECLEGHIAIAMVPIENLQETIACPGLDNYTQEMVFTHRDEIKALIADHLKSRKADYWLTLLREKGLWVMDLKDWKRMRAEEGYQKMQLEQDVNLDNGRTITTTRCPILIDKNRLLSSKSAPLLGKDTDRIKVEFKLKNLQS